MAINIPMATPGLLANPQPYVNLGLLAPQGGQAARLQAPPASMGGQQQMGLGGALGSLGDAFSSMGKANRDRAEFESRQAYNQLAQANMQSQIDARAIQQNQELEVRGLGVRAAQSLLGVKPVSDRTDQIAQSVANGASIANQANAAAASGMPGPEITPVSHTRRYWVEPGDSPSEMNRVPDVTETALGLRPARYPDEPPYRDSGDNTTIGWPIARPADVGGGRTFADWRADQLAPTAVEMLANAPQDISGDLTPLGDPLDLPPQAGEPATERPANPMADMFAGLTDPERQQFAARFLTVKDSSGFNTVMKDAMERLSPAAIQKAYVDTTKEYFTASREFRDKKDAYKSLLQVLAEQTGSGDIAALKLFVQTFEKGVVQAGEAELVLGSTSIAERFQAIIGKAKGGLLFTLSQREKFAATAKIAYETALSRQEKVDARYKPSFDLLALRNPENRFVSSIDEVDEYKSVGPAWAELSQWDANDPGGFSLAQASKVIDISNIEQMLNPLTSGLTEAMWAKFPEETQTYLINLAKQYKAAAASLRAAQGE